MTDWLAALRQPDGSTGDQEVEPAFSSKYKKVHNNVPGTALRFFVLQTTFCAVPGTFSIIYHP